MKHIIIYILVFIVLTSCNQSGKPTVKKDIIKKNSVTSKTTVTIRANDTLTIPEDTIPKITIPEGAIEVAEDQLDTGDKVKILYNGSYNEQDDVGPKDAKLDWKGIFYNKDNYYIKPTKISFIKEHSKMDEEENQMTGWRLKCEVKDSCFKLISGVDNLVTGPIKRPFKELRFYYAGQKVVFNYEGVTYTLYTTGSNRDGWIYNCKLYLMANIKGHIFNQLLRSLGNDIVLNGGGDMSNDMDLELVGDLDGDKIPDFIISGAGYSFGEDYLYLSKPAGSKAIVKLVAHFFTSD